MSVDHPNPRCRHRPWPSRLPSEDGLQVEMLNLLAVKMNFSITYVEDRRIKSILALDLRSLNAKEYQDEIGFFSHPFIFAPLKLLVPLGEFYTLEEKLWLPFDLETWICFISVFFVALLVTFLLSTSRDSLKEYFFGSNVKTPTMNLFQHFFGFGQTILPKNNFARFILMMFILFCLIMRNAYQGKMFEFLTSDMRKKGVATIAEIIEHNMTIFISSNIEKLISGIDVLKRWVKVLSEID